MFDLCKLKKRALLKCSREYKSEFNTSKCSITISVGQSVHEGDKFEATLVEVNDSFRECTIMVCDSLQRHTLKIGSDLTMEELHIKSNQLGEEWLKRNMGAITQLTIKYKIIRWDEWLSSAEYKTARCEIDELYSRDVDFYSAIEKTSLVFLERYTNRGTVPELRENILYNSREYLKEEAAVMLIWAQSGYQFEVYPSPRNFALRFVYQNVIAKRTPDLVREISVKFKTVAVNKNNKLSQDIGAFPEFEGLINSLPGHVYVLDTNNIYKGCNLLQAKAFGFSNAADVIGKRNKDMPIFIRHPALADIVDNNNLKVMRNATTDPVELEEEAPYINSEIGIFKSYKIPLFNKARRVVGLLGISYDITQSKKEFQRLQERCAEKELALDNLLANLPGHVYWMDTKNRFLGCNDQQAHDLGLKSRHEIVGLSAKYSQTPNNAATIIKNNNKVMGKGGVITEEEQFKDTVGKDCIYFSRKVPLKNKHGEIVGLLGISLDITAEKDAEKLRLDAEAHKTLDLAQQEFRETVGQMVHDIRQPLASLQMMVSSTKEIPEEKRITLRDSTIAITDITSQLLRRYEPEHKTEVDVVDRQLVLVSTILSDIVGDRRRKYKDLPIRFEYEITQLNAFVFIKANISGFKRAISNLINNAVEALPKAGGKIYIRLSANDEWVNISILDDGAGIAKNVLDKIKNRENITQGKPGGHGIGLSQVRDMVEANYGEFDIVSSIEKKSHGTTISLRFPKVFDPDWIAEEVNFQKDDIVVILDDDKGIHVGWDSRLEYILDKVPTIQVQHFFDGQVAIDFINGLSVAERKRVCFLSDYELINQKMNGLEVIAKTKIKRSMLVTSHYANIELRKTTLQSKVKILPKDLVHIVPIQVVQAKVKGEMVNVHMVFVDDEKGFTNTLIARHYGHLITDKYSNPLEFLDEVGKYPKETRFILDNYYYMPDGGTYNIDGITLAQKLHAKGYTKLIMLSGEEFSAPEYLTLILKTDQSRLSQLDKL